MTKPLVKGLFYILCLIFGHGSSNIANAQLSDMKDFKMDGADEPFEVASCAFDNNNNNNHSQYISSARNAMSIY